MVSTHRFLCPSDLRIATSYPLIPFLVIYHSYVAQTFSLCPIPPHFVKFGNGYTSSYVAQTFSYVRPTSRSRPTKYHTHIRCFLLSESQISRITPTQKFVTSGNPPSKQIWSLPYLHLSELAIMSATNTRSLKIRNTFIVTKYATIRCFLSSGNRRSASRLFPLIQVCTSGNSPSKQLGTLPYLRRC